MRRAVPVVAAVLAAFAGGAAVGAQGPPQVVATVLASAGVLVKPIATCCLPSA